MADPISILIIDNSFTFGGAINSMANFLKALNKETFRPVVVSGQSQDFLETHFPGCHVVHFRPKLPWVDNGFFNQVRKWSLYRIRLFRKFIHLLRYLYWLIAIHLPEAVAYSRLGRRHKVALVHLNNILGSQLSGILAARLLGVPCVAHLRDFEELHPLTRLYARLIDQHVAISQAIADNLRDLGVPADRIQVVHDALDLDKFRSDVVDCGTLRAEFNLSPHHLCFGLFGRVIPWKGTEEFLRATRQVIDRIPESRAFVVGGCSDGDNTYLERMKALVSEWDREEAVIFTGFRSDIPALMKMMDVVVHASTRPEPFGMVLIEGMAMGKPVVATRGGGALDIVEDQKTGLLVKIGDQDALAQSILCLLQSEDLRQRLGEQARRRVERDFSNRVYARKMEAIYMSMVGPTRSDRNEQDD